jgi:hypothetical protein
MSTPYNGQSATQSIPGISGENTAGGVGVAGTSGNTPGVGVQAANTGSGYGVDASSALGVGLHATGQTQAALFEGSVNVFNKSSGGVPGAIVAAPALTLDVHGVTGPPATSGTSQTGVARMEASDNNVLDFGCLGTAPYGVWLQGTDRTSLGLSYPLYLQPNGGPVIIGTTEPAQSIGLLVVAPPPPPQGGGPQAATFDGNVSIDGNLGIDGNVGIGTDVGTELPALTLDVYGVTGPPATSGTSQTGVVRMEAGNNNVLDFGCPGTAPYGVWLQGTDRTSLGLSYPLVLQPNGGYVGIGTTSPGAPLEVVGSGSAIYLSYSGSQRAFALNPSSAGAWTMYDHAASSGTAWTAGITQSSGNVGIGTTSPTETLTVNGSVSVTGDITLTGATGDISFADCAEEFDIIAATEVEPGTVMVLGRDGALQPSQEAYDKKVVGVVSGAGNYRSGLILDRQKFSEGRRPLALVGKVYCKVDASYGAIEVGDLLTTSPTSGHAMRASDALKAFGAIIGKALRPVDTGQALIPILIALL